MNKIKIKEHYKCVIVGGGIVGSGVFREMASHGISTLLIDKFDFNSQTSASSSKMLHGGIRYLENMDFSLVHEALHEKNLWLEKVPHLAKERSFFLPVFKDSIRPLWMINIGLWLYDLLSGFMNSPHSTKNSTQVNQSLPGIKTSGLTGAGVYFDSVVDDIKLGLELIYEGNKKTNADALNYHELTDIKIVNENLVELQIRDTLTNETYEVSCNELVLTTGPFTDKILQKVEGLSWKKKMVPSKGSHIWFKKDKFTFEQSVVLTPNDGRVIFLIPYEEKVLFGTTEVALTDADFNMSISQNEQDYLISNINEFFPGLGIDESDILSSYAGVRPLVKEDADAPVGKVARNHKYFQPRSNIHVMIGGKYTTFRVMAMDVAKVVLERINVTYNEKYSVVTPLQKSVFLPFDHTPITPENVLLSARTEMVRTFEDLVKRRMGIPNKKHWKESKDFDQFFLDIKHELSEHILISEEDIKNFN